MIGTRQAQPIGRTLPRPFVPITVRIGPRLDVLAKGNRADDPVALRAITEEVMSRVQSLSGQEYVPAYSGRTDPPPEAA